MRRVSVFSSRSDQLTAMRREEPAGPRAIQPIAQQAEQEFPPPDGVRAHHAGTPAAEARARRPCPHRGRHFSSWFGPHGAGCGCGRGGGPRELSSGPLLCGSGWWSLSSSFLPKRPLWECEDVQEASVGPGGGLPLRQEACGDRWVRLAGARSRGSGFVGLWQGVGPAVESLSAIGRLGRGPSVCGQGERPVVATRPRAAGVRSGPRGLGIRVRPAAGESGWNRVAKGTAPWAAPGGGESCLLGDRGELTSGPLFGGRRRASFH